MCNVRGRVEKDVQCARVLKYIRANDLHEEIRKKLKLKGFEINGLKI